VKGKGKGKPELGKGRQRAVQEEPPKSLQDIQALSENILSNSFALSKEAEGTGGGKKKKTPETPKYVTQAFTQQPLSLFLLEAKKEVQASFFRFLGDEEEDEEREEEGDEDMEEGRKEGKAREFEVKDKRESCSLSVANATVSFFFGDKNPIFF
jgi:hypothetical protein